MGTSFRPAHFKSLGVRSGKIKPQGGNLLYFALPSLVDKAAGRVVLPGPQPVRRRLTFPLHLNPNEPCVHVVNLHSWVRQLAEVRDLFLPGTELLPRFFQLPRLVERFGFRVEGLQFRAQS